MKTNLLLTVACLLIAFSALSSPSRAAELITNGSFETGNFTGWTAVNNSGGWKNWAIGTTGQTTNDGTYTPVPTPMVVPGGSFVAYNGVTGNANSPYLLYQTITVPVGYHVRMTWTDRYQMNHTQFCGSVSNPCGTATYAVEIVNTANVLLQTLYTVTTPNNTNTNTGYVNHLAALTAYQGQTIRIRFRATVSNTYAGPGQLEIDSVSVQTLQPTAAGVSVTGRVSDGFGIGLSRVSVSLADSNGNLRYATTNNFGIYTFADVPAGSVYFLTAQHRRYSFSDNPRIVTVMDNVTDVDFNADAGEKGLTQQKDID